MTYCSACMVNILEYIAHLHHHLDVFLRLNSDSFLFRSSTMSGNLSTMRRKKITCSFSEKNGRFGHCFRKFIEQVIFFQALNPGLLFDGQQTLDKSHHLHHGYIAHSTAVSSLYAPSVLLSPARLRCSGTCAAASSGVLQRKKHSQVFEQGCHVFTCTFHAAILLRCLTP